MKHLFAFPLVLLLCTHFTSFSQNKYELKQGWKCSPVLKVNDNGLRISSTSYPLTGWMPAVVPGTVLTTMLENKQIPDPFYGMNNKNIPDIFHTGRDYYTYWFVKDFNETIKSGEQAWLHFRGINYSCDIFLNGKKLNKERHSGMFLRQSYNITASINKNGANRLAVIVYPPDPVGNPNGGQGGDGTIAKNVTHQYVAGWDWIQPVRDRNTGIWDKVTIEKTGKINIKNPHVITLVPGQRKPDGAQKPATVKVSAELENPTALPVKGLLQYTMAGKKVSREVTLKANVTAEITLPDLPLENPKLWWPAGYGDQFLYPMNMQFIISGAVSDEENLHVGVRQIQAETNTVTRSKQISVNGQRVFMKGGNWIISDAMLRFSPERYDAEIRFHRDMNLNLLRIWGGALTERPEFYEACDKYGILVMQDFWGSGDCNGRWPDPMKADDQWTRRKYPDDHDLFLTSAADQIKMIRNYPSLAMWCGGNEITLPQDLMFPLRDSILPKLDGTRWFVDYSNSDDMSFNSLGGGGDGPYGIQPLKRFFEYRTWPFNSEIGSVGVGDYQSLERFIPKENLISPEYLTGQREKVDSVWNYHKYIGYSDHINAYGKPKDVEDFGKKAQLVNYDQYRSLMEGFSAHMWEWYTGVIIWKTQNPWTALRGQMYDYYLDPNACLYGLHNGSAPLHIMFNQADSTIMVANNTFNHQYDLMMVVKGIDMQGKEKNLGQAFIEIGPSTTRPIFPIKNDIRQMAKKEGMFLSMRLMNLKQEIVSDNLYWLPDAEGNYSGLNQMPKADIDIQARKTAKGKVEVVLSNSPSNTIAFFNRLSLVDPTTRKRILPVFYDDNYVSILPGEKKTVLMDYTETGITPLVSIDGWNVKEQFIPVK
ncbi:glycoside hydrolase family 2 protein [Dyadobacter psychrotolerans]|uniref:Glycosyl hydrolase n=1 Tax=Dyadobacter psychrotolerans TaxID=2541721 RepID=A0A4V2Z3Y2_9BACT|nr:glycoside hydrolase family 2 TIM barrel-domain containing protein [Dyadobacter psychrotolerans]TDE14478.1 glycosyl hydrolase [Dyadobacter psychrotolerans]